MHADLALQMLGDVFWTGFVVSGPVLAVVMAVGLAISLLQVITQVQEMSLTFVPKLVASAAALILLGPWMLRTLTAFTARLWAGIPSML